MSFLFSLIHAVIELRLTAYYVPGIVLAHTSLMLASHGPSYAAVVCINKRESWKSNSMLENNIKSEKRCPGGQKGPEEKHENITNEKINKAVQEKYSEKKRKKERMELA